MDISQYASAFPGLSDEDFVAAGFTPEQVAEYRGGYMTPRAYDPAQTVSTQQPNRFGDVAAMYGNEEIRGGLDLAFDPNVSLYGALPASMQGGMMEPINRQIMRALDVPLGLLGAAWGLGQKGIALGAEAVASGTESEKRLARDLIGGAEIAGVGPEGRMLAAISEAGGLGAAARTVAERANQPGRMPETLYSNPLIPSAGRAPVTFSDVERAMQEAPEPPAAPGVPPVTPAMAEAPPTPPGALPAPPPALERVAPPEPLPVVPKPDVSVLVAKPERAIIKSAVPRAKQGAVSEQVAGQKASYPAEDGWAQGVMQVTNIKPKKDNFEVIYKEVPYEFNKPPVGVEPDQWRATMADRAVNEVRQLADRVRAGDPAARAIMNEANWYRAMRTRLREEFGGLGDVFADVLGATSAQTGVEMNWNNAIEVMRRFSRGEFDKELNMYEDMLEKGNVNPTKLGQMHNDPDNPFRLITNAAGSLFNANSPAATKALFDMFRVADGAPKTPNFTGNLIGYTNAATIDVWAARFLRRIAGLDRLPPPVESGVKGKHLAGSTLQSPRIGQEFGFGQDVLADAARRINEEGIVKSVAPDLAAMNPDDLQAVAWFIEKEKWTNNGWTNKAGEGGSFELEASFAGAEDPAQIKSLRRQTTASFKAPNRRKTETDEQYAARVEEARAAHNAQGADAQKQLDELKAPLARYVLGISVERPGQRPTNVQQAEVAARLGEPAKADPSVVTYQVNNTYGRFMQSDERAFNAEFVVRRNFDPSGVTRRMVEVAKEADQDAAFISKVVPERTPDSRPGVEIYFQQRQDPDFARRLSDKLTEYGVDGFTFVTDSRVKDQPARQAALNEEAVAGINGLRFQYIPEFDMGAETWRKMTPEEKAAKIDEIEGLFDDITRDIVKSEEGISAANLTHYETNVIERGDYDEYLR